MITSTRVRNREKGVCGFLRFFFLNKFIDKKLFSRQNTDDGRTKFIYLFFASNKQITLKVNDDLQDFIFFFYSLLRKRYFPIFFFFVNFEQKFSRQTNFFFAKIFFFS